MVKTFSCSPIPRRTARSSNAPASARHPERKCGLASGSPRAIRLTLMVDLAFIPRKTTRARASQLPRDRHSPSAPSRFPCVVPCPS